MLAVVKKPRTDKELFSVHGDIPKYLLKQLEERYGENLKLFKDDDSELIDVTQTDWYRDFEASITPGKSIKNYRDNFRLTQKQLGEKLSESPQQISDYETDRKRVSKNFALKLSAFFDAPIELFIK